MLLKVIVGQEEWLILNADCHFIHLKLLIQSKCPRWPEGNTAVLDLCDTDTGTLMRLHALDAWDMAADCFKQVDTHKKVFTPVAMTIDNGIILSLEPMVDNFEEHFPEAKAVLDSLVNTKIKGGSTVKSSAKSMAIQPSPKDAKAKGKAGGKKGKEKKQAKK